MKEKEIIKNVIENKRVVTGPDYRDMGAILLFIFLLPYIVSFFFGNAGIGEELEENMPDEKVAFEVEMFREDLSEAEYIVCNTTIAGTEKIPLETYLVSRLPATIDMEYELEVLKAQAIVLRTELLRNYYETKHTAEANDGNAQNEEGKHYIYIESSLPQVSEQVYEKSKEAVSSTRGMYLTYEKVPATAPYFAVSAGMTRNGSEAFHSEDYPYLKSVVCERDFTSENYVQTIKLSKQAFYERLWELANEKNMSKEEEHGQVQELLSQGLEKSVSVNRDSAGYVTDVLVDGAYISGEGIRSAFLLNSSCFEWEEEGSTVVIRVKGVGHGLGLCHYGANEMAKEGNDYINILQYFFADIVIEKTE